MGVGGRRLPCVGSTQNWRRGIEPLARSWLAGQLHATCHALATANEEALDGQWRTTSSGRREQKRSERRGISQQWAGVTGVWLVEGWYVCCMGWLASVHTGAQEPPRQRADESHLLFRAATTTCLAKPPSMAWQVARWERVADVALFTSFEEGSGRHIVMP